MNSGGATLRGALIFPRSGHVRTKGAMEALIARMSRCFHRNMIDQSTMQAGS